MIAKRSRFQEAQNPYINGNLCHFEALCMSRDVIASTKRVTLFRAGSAKHQTTTGAPVLGKRACGVMRRSGWSQPRMCTMCYAEVFAALTS